jgi:hypothetical protein
MDKLLVKYWESSSQWGARNLGHGWYKREVVRHGLEWESVERSNLPRFFNDVLTKLATAYRHKWKGE